MKSINIVKKNETSTTKCFIHIPSHNHAIYSKKDFRLPKIETLNFARRLKLTSFHSFMQFHIPSKAMRNLDSILFSMAVIRMIVGNFSVYENNTVDGFKYLKYFCFG